MSSFLRQGPKSLARWRTEGHVPAGRKLLLLVDQFERIVPICRLYRNSTKLKPLLRYYWQHPKSRDLSTSSLRCGPSFSRSGPASRLADRINRSLYVSPRMTREEMESAIVGPAAVCGFSIEPALVNRLFERSGDFSRPRKRRVSRLAIFARPSRRSVAIDAACIEPIMAEGSVSRRASRVAPVRLRRRSRRWDPST